MCIRDRAYVAYDDLNQHAPTLLLPDGYAPWQPSFYRAKAIPHCQSHSAKWTEVLRTCTNSTVGFIAGDLKAGTTYTFRIRAYKTSGDTVIYSNYTRLAAVTNAN